MKTGTLYVLFTILGFSAFAQQRSKLLPDYASLQYAGSVGWVSAGAEYDVFRERGRLGLKYGVVPKNQGGKLHILSASLFYEPFKLKLSDRIQVNPLDVGMLVSYHFGDNFHSRWPSRYPDGYYWWTTSFLVHLATQTSLTWEMPTSFPFRSLTGYVELNTNDLYLVSFIQNSNSLRLGEVVKTGLGIRLKF